MAKTARRRQARKADGEPPQTCIDTTDASQASTEADASTPSNRPGLAPSVPKHSRWPHARGNRRRLGNPWHKTDCEELNAEKHRRQVSANQNQRRRNGGPQTAQTSTCHQGWCDQTTATPACRAHIATSAPAAGLGPTIKQGAAQNSTTQSAKGTPVFNQQKTLAHGM